MIEKIAEAVCIATQKTNYSCGNIKHTCKKNGGCAYCLVMAEELIANGITLANHQIEKGSEEEGEWVTYFDSYECTACGQRFYINESTEDYDPISDWSLHFCPNCGKKMKGGAE